EWRRALFSAHNAWMRADRLAAGDQAMLALDLRVRLETLDGKLRADEEDRQLAVELDRIRLESANAVNGTIELARAGPQMERALQAAQFDFTHGDPALAAEQVRASPIRLPLVAGLDFGALATSDEALRARLLEIARGADPDSWRDRFRRSASWSDLANLQS